VDETTRKARELDALENIVRELERLRVLKEHELGVRLEESKEGGGPYVPIVEK
jgi:division protein CdvB (Snf7/Vps24/ESCRT-III family)